MATRPRRAFWLGVALALGVARSGAAQGTTSAVPRRWRAAVQGCWRLGPVYTVDFAARGHDGLTVVQRGAGPGRQARRDEVVRYDPAHDVIGFPAIAAHHRAVVRLELRGGQLRYVFSVSRDGVHWVDRVPDVATRCAP